MGWVPRRRGTYGSRIFWDVLSVALPRIVPDVVLSVMHDATSPKVILQQIREEVLAIGLRPTGQIAIPRAIWERYVPASFRR